MELTKNGFSISIFGSNSAESLSFHEFNAKICSASFNQDNSEQTREAEQGMNEKIMGFPEFTEIIEAEPLQEVTDEVNQRKGLKRLLFWRK